MFENIIVETGDGIELITLNRPEVSNVLDIDTVSELREAIEYAESTEDIKVVIIRGSGGRVFSMGEDLEEMNSLAPSDLRSMIANGQALMEEIEMLPKPVIAAVEGYCFGSGFELALAADIRIAAENAVFAFTESSLGMIPGFGGPTRLAKLIGVSKAQYYCMTEEWIDAQDAFDSGLAARISEPETLLDDAIGMAETLMKKSAASIAALKRLLHEGMELSHDDAPGFERKLFDSVFFSKERSGLMQDFFEKQNR